jgi:hypothetical protein
MRVHSVHTDYMPNLNLSPHQAAAVRSAMVAVNFVGGTVHIQFDPVDVYISESGWLTVRDGPHGYEEHKDLSEFERAYGLWRPEVSGLLALAHDMESLCEARLHDAQAADDFLQAATWAELMERCRAAIAIPSERPIS